METNMSNVTSINQDRSFSVTSSPDEATLKMPWGISPPVAKPIAWGAQAIFRRTTHTASVDVFDSSMIIGGNVAEHGAFTKWIDQEILPLIRKEVLASDVWPRDATQVELPWKGFTIVFSPRMSVNYLYIGVWPSEGAIAASREVNGLSPDPVKRDRRHKGGAPKKGAAKKPHWAVVIEPGQQPEVRDIGDSKLETLQKLVGGYIEHVNFYPKPRYTVCVNEEGRINGLTHNVTRPVRKGEERTGVHQLHGTIVLYQVKGMTRDAAEKFAAEWRR